MKKKLAVLAAFLMVVSSLSACNSGENKETAENTSATQTTAPEGAALDPTQINGDSFATWKDIDRNAVIAEVTGENASDSLKVTFGEFYSEYLFYLVNYGIADDMAGDTAADCEGYRREVINYLTFEKQFMYVAENVYNCGEKQLTEADKAEIQKNYEEVIANWKEGYKDVANQLLGGNATDEQLDKKCSEMLDSDLARCEMTTGTLYEQEVCKYILDKLTEAVAAEATVDRSEAEEMYNDYYNAAVEAYNNDKASYERNPSYTSVYIPEGSRRATHIFIPFDNETAGQIAEKRLDGLDEEADELRKAAANGEISTTLSEALDKLVAVGMGELDSTMEEVISEYNPDGAVEYYTVVPDSVLYYPEYHEALFSLKEEGEISTPVLCDNGAYIIIYLGEAYYTEEDIAETKESMYQFLLTNRQESRQSELIEEWDKKYPFYVNYDLLRITPEEEEITEDANTVS